MQVVAGGAPELWLTAQEAKVPLERNWEFSAASPGAPHCHLCDGVGLRLAVVAIKA